MVYRADACCLQNAKRVAILSVARPLEPDVYRDAYCKYVLADTEIVNIEYLQLAEEQNVNYFDAQGFDAILMVIAGCTNGLDANGLPEFFDLIGVQLAIRFIAHYSGKVCYLLTEEPNLILHFADSLHVMLDKYPAGYGRQSLLLEYSFYCQKQLGKYLLETNSDLHPIAKEADVALANLSSSNLLIASDLISGFVTISANNKADMQKASASLLLHTGVQKVLDLLLIPEFWYMLSDESSHLLIPADIADLLEQHATELNWTVSYRNLFVVRSNWSVARKLTRFTEEPAYRKLVADAKAKWLADLLPCPAKLQP